MTITTPNSAGRYADVNGISLYYEVHGTGNPLLLLHGGFGSFETFAALVPTLAEKYQVIGVDLFYAAYVRIAPRPDDFARFVVNMRAAMSKDYDWSVSVSAFKCPVLILAGDADGLPPSHAAEFFTLLGGGLKDAGWTGEHLTASQLAILPGATHYDILSHMDLLLRVLTTFLDK